MGSRCNGVLKSFDVCLGWDVQSTSPVLVRVVVFDTDDLHCARVVQCLKHAFLIKTGVHVVRWALLYIFIWCICTSMSSSCAASDQTF